MDKKDVRTLCFVTVLLGTRCMSENTRKKGTDHPKATGVYITIAVFERFWVVSPFFTPVLFFIIYPVRQLLCFFVNIRVWVLVFPCV